MPVCVGSLSGCKKIKNPINYKVMEVLKFNSNGFPLYWFDRETMKVWKRIDKNTSQRVKCPKQFASKVLRLRMEILNSKTI